MFIARARPRDAADITLGSVGPLGFDDSVPGGRTAWIADSKGPIVEINQGDVDQENPPAA